VQFQFAAAMIFLLSKPESSFQPRSTLSVKTAKAEVFYFHEFLDAVVGTFTTKPGLLHPPNGATSFEIKPVLIPTMPLQGPLLPARCGRYRDCKSNSRFYRGDQFLGKSIINPGLDVKPVRANAVAVFVTKKLNTPGAMARQPRWD
jgi:hypothetical protein